jgi:hypothetical protein
MKTRLSENETKFWQDCANDWEAASCALTRIELRMMKHEIMPIKACNAIGEAIDKISGQRYMWTPQSEWLGGDSSLAENHCMRPPHIVTDISQKV